MSGRPDVQRLDRKDLPEDAPSWAEMFIEAHNKSVDAILDLASAPTNALLPRPSKLPSHTTST